MTWVGRKQEKVGRSGVMKGVGMEMGKAFCIREKWMMIISFSPAYTSLMQLLPSFPYHVLIGEN